MLSAVVLMLSMAAGATPANKNAFTAYFGRFLPEALNSCGTCHQSSTYSHLPTSLAEFPHNSFGKRLAQAGEEMRKQGLRADIASRMQRIATEDADHDGIDNLTEILLGTGPGNATEHPNAAQLKTAASLKLRLSRYLAEYRWRPFEPVTRPTLPRTPTPLGITNPVDAFLSSARLQHNLVARPEADKQTLLRRVYLDLTGLQPTPVETAAFMAETRPDAYERTVDTLLSSQRYGERWGRHWMDVWRYSDWAGWADGNQIRDSKPFIWRWRDWIVDSLNQDKGYDQMVREMLAADEIAPEDPTALRATGYLVRNFKLLSREQWMDDLLNHTGRAFMGVTLGCAKCHNHMYDPITQDEYYRVRAVFEPHNVRTDRVPGQPDVTKDGLVHAFDADPKATTYFFVRGDERNPDKSRPMAPGVPAVFGGSFKVTPVALPQLAVNPDRRGFVIAEARDAADLAIRDAEDKLTQPGGNLNEKLAAVKNAHAAQTALEAVLDAEKAEELPAGKTSQEWKLAATAASKAQKQADVAANVLALIRARSAATAAAAADTNAGEKAANHAALAAARKVADEAVAKAETALRTARAALDAKPGTDFRPRVATTYPATSTGRRTAFANWLASRENPLTARVAANQIWMRHFGTGIVPSVDDFGANGRKPSHPELLDWLASELMSSNWRMKPLHRLIVTSRAYRMASTADPVSLKRDPDNVYLWRMPSRRMEAELVRDNILYASGDLDEMRGGPEVDHMQGLKSRRRSLYLQSAAEKQVEFLSIFDGPSVSECYARKPSVMPQQALALANSEIAIGEATALAKRLDPTLALTPAQFVEKASLAVLARQPSVEERRLCTEFLEKGVQPTSGVKQASLNAAEQPSLERRRMNLILVLFNHTDFVTIR